MNYIDATTRLITLLGSPVSHSKSPKLQNFLFELLGENYCYLAVDTKKEDLEDIILSLKNLNARGMNITFPLKVEILKYLDEIDSETKLSGAVNTVVIGDDGKLIGYNTDGIGFITSLEYLNLDIRNKKILVVGAGGAGRAIGIMLAKSFASEIVIVEKEKNRDKSQGLLDIISNKMQSKTKVRIIESNDINIKNELSDVYMLINATSLGLKDKNQCIVSSKEVLSKTSAFIYDLVYSDKKTKLIEYAEQNNLQNTNGVPMLLCQGIESCKLWTGKSASVEEIINSLKL